MAPLDTGLAPPAAARRVSQARERTGCETGLEAVAADALRRAADPAWSPSPRAAD